MMKRLFATLLTAILVACATQSPNAQIKLAYDTVDAYVQATTTALARGRITADQAARASTNAKQAKAQIDNVATVLAGCKPPCDPAKIVQNLQPMLLELEKDLRAQEGATK